MQGMFFRTAHKYRSSSEHAILITAKLSRSRINRNNIVVFSNTDISPNIGTSTWGSLSLSAAAAGRSGLVRVGRSPRYIKKVQIHS